MVCVNHKSEYESSWKRDSTWRTYLFQCNILGGLNPRCPSECSYSLFFLPLIFKENAWGLFIICTKTSQRQPSLACTVVGWLLYWAQPKRGADFSAHLCSWSGTDFLPLLSITHYFNDFPFEFVSASHSLSGHIASIFKLGTSLLWYCCYYSLDFGITFHLFYILIAFLSLQHLSACLSPSFSVTIFKWIICR